LRLRNLDASDRPMLRDYWRSLSAQERRLRFNWAATDEVLDQYTRSIDFEDAKVVGVFDGDELKGVAEIIPCEQGSSADLAIVLSKDVQGQQMADKMMDVLRHQARSMGIDTLQAHMDPNNQAMKRLARRSGFVLQTEDCELIGRARLACAHP
jgi:RimJ/RimL family protein N-acetyltransferase